MNTQLNQALQLLKTHQRRAAHLILDAYLAESPRDPWAWYLLSFVLTNGRDQRAAAQQAYHLSPHNPRFHTRTVQLEKAALNQLTQIIKIAVVFALVSTVIFGLLTHIQLIQLPERQLPTLIAFAASSATPTAEPVLPRTQDQAVLSQPVLSPVVPVQTNSLRPTVTATTLTLGTLAEAASVLPQAAATSTRVESVQRANPGVDQVAITSPDSVLPSPVPPLIPTTIVTSTPVTEETAPTDIANTPSPTVTAVSTASASISTDPGISLNTSLDVGVGQMRVINATRSAETLIRDLGGSVPPAPGDQAWALVEVLLVCREASSCGAETSAFVITDASGRVYSPSPQFNISPVLGTSVSNGQVWGYLGFVIPKQDTQLRLVLTRGSQSYTFALQ